MSNVDIIIEERARDIGNFMVGRLLPFRQKRMVGPFIYIDHMGPVTLGPGENFDILPHPHIGLSTLTFLFEGRIVHRDSLGTEMEIEPGAVNWMTAGSGIVHSERTPERLRKETKTMHGLQIWVALPRELEDMEPEFFHIEEEGLPTWTEGDAEFKLVAGEAMGRKSKVPVYSKLYMLEIKTTHRQTLDLAGQLYGESGLYIMEGSIENNGHNYGPKQILVTKDAGLCAFTASENTTVYIFGGEPFPEERHIEWNFVASTREKIENAKARWRKQEFVPVPGETEFIPLPERRM